MTSTNQIIHLIDTVPIPALVLDAQLNICHGNPSACDFFAIECELLKSKNIVDLLKDLDVTRLQTPFGVDDYSYLKNNSNFKLTLKLERLGDAPNLSLLYLQIKTIQPIDTEIQLSDQLDYQIKIYNQFLDTIKEGIFVFNAKGQLIFANNKARDYFSIHQSNNRILIWNLFERFISKANWELEKKKIGINEEIQFFIELNSENQYKSFAITFSHRNIYSDSNYLAIVTDTTESKKQEAEISKKDNELAIFYQNLPVAIFEFVVEDFSTNYFTYLSPSFYSIFPFNVTINDANWHQNIVFDKQDFQSFIDEIIRTSTDNSNFNYIGRFQYNNELIWFEITSNSAQSTGKYVLNGVIKNITENKLIEGEIIKKGKFNNLVLDNIPADIAVFDADHNYKFINKRGIENDSLRNWLINKNDFDYCALKGLDTKLAQERRDYFNLAKTTKKQVDWVDEIQKNEKSVYIYRRFFPVFVDNELNSMIGYGIDITELKQSQKLLNQQNAILTEKNKELERFAYIASHDLQEPLISIMGYSDLLREYHSASLDKEGILCLDFINKSALRMRTLIHALMEYSRIENKEQLKTVDLNLLLQEIQNDLSSKIKKYNAIISTSQLPQIKCYPTFIRMLFQNIISNAIKYTAKDVAPIILITFEEHPNHWLFSIKDNGIGIDEKKYDEIFLIFKRLHNQSEYKGNGIGLAHCKKIVTIHQGDIWVNSVINEGSTFYFSISKNIQNA